MTEHRFNGVSGNEDGSYTSRCKCGESFTGPTKVECADLEQRKNFAWTAVAEHMVNFNPDLKSIAAQVAERRE